MKKIKAMLLSAGIMTGVSVALLAAIALIFEKTSSLPRGMIPTMTTLIGCISVFIASLLSSMYAREKGIIQGVFSGLICILCIALISVLVFHNDFNMASAGKAAAILLSGSIGGILGVNRKSKVRF